MRTEQSVAAEMAQLSKIVVEGFDSGMVTVGSQTMTKMAALELAEVLMSIVEEMEKEEGMYSTCGESCTWMPGMAECDELG